MMKKRYILLFYALFNFIAWNYFGLALIVVIGLSFYYLKIIELKKWHHKLLLIFILTFIFNISSTFWLLKTSWWESLLAFLVNSGLMLIPLFLALNFKNKIFYSYTFFWISFEMFHANWDFSWPWLTFGNALGNLHFLVQWYSVLGVYGGSLWLILLGYFLYKIILDNNSRKTIFQFFSLLLIPSIISLLMYSFEFSEKEEPLKIITYITLDDKESNYEKIKKLFLKIKNKPELDFLISPEIFLSKTNLSNLKEKEESIYLKKIIRTFPSTNILWGVELINKKQQLFNTIMYSKNGSYSFRTKKKYVPFREYVPSILRDLIGANFYTKNIIDNHNYIISETKIFPILCYESIFSSFVARNSINSKAIFLLASEEFMNKSYFGKKQYLNIVRLRAIENKRYLLKCSTTNGISCIINEKGDVTKYISKDVDTFNLPSIKDNSIYQIIISSI
ncbi:MAG: apolipoprotein N-acyltransferase [Flavobacteriaceae bacterium]|jgi:apolipoprotein N-acyltransferase